MASAPSPSMGVRAPRYLRRFQCIGSACEHTCCGGWRIHVDRAHYERLRDVMGGSDAERGEFEQHVELVPTPGGDPEYHATIRMRPDGHCGFLEENRQCSVQRRYGEGLLGNMCALYPRDISRIGRNIEVTATLSCPEVARQCLLVEDALDLEDLDPGLVPRPHILRGLDPEPGVPYLEHFDGIRGRMLELLSSSRYPLATRLFFVAYLSKRISPFFNRNEHSQNGDATNRLAAELSRFDEAAFLDELHRQFTAIEIPVDQAFKVIEVIVLARLQVHIPYFRQLVTDAVASYGDAANAADGPRTELWSGYQRRRDHWTDSHGAALDRWFGNYCKNYWLRDWYVQSPDLVTHTQKLLIRLAILRFLLFSDPRLQAVASSKSALDEGILQTTAIDVIHKVVRALEHDPSFLQRVQDALEAEDFRSFAHLVLLLKF